MIIIMIYSGDPFIYISRAELKPPLAHFFPAPCEAKWRSNEHKSLRLGRHTLKLRSHPPISISITSFSQRIVLKLIGKAFTEVSGYNFLIYFESLITRQRMESTSPNEKSTDESLMGVLQTQLLAGR